MVLDAKYRVSRPNVVDAMDSAHLYHDSLRWGDARPWASVLLVPRGGGAIWMETPAFLEEHGVGVIEFSVDSDQSGLLSSPRLGERGPIASVHPREMITAGRLSRSQSTSSTRRRSATSSNT